MQRKLCNSKAFIQLLKPTKCTFHWKLNLVLCRVWQISYLYSSDAKVGKHTEEGWGNSAYVVSKVGCSALSFIQQRIFDNEKPCRNISVNAVHPGYVDTDMTSHKGHLSIEEGAAAPLHLALDDHGLKGKYIWHDKTVVDWYGETPAIYWKSKSVHWYFLPISYDLCNT